MPHTRGIDNPQYQIAEQQITDAFFSLLDSFDFNEITVSQIIAESGINRSTFYRHYKDKYDILDQIQKDAYSLAVQFMNMSENSPKNIVAFITDLANITFPFTTQQKQRFVKLIKISSANFNLHDFMHAGFMQSYNPSPNSSFPDFEQRLFADIAFSTVMYQMQYDSSSIDCQLSDVLKSITENLS